MRWQDSAITRRDEQLARTRRLTTWIAGGATAASFGLAGALGFALPGHTATSGTGRRSHAGRTAGRGGSQGSGSASRPGTGSHGHAGPAHRHHQLAPPRKPPASSGGGTRDILGWLVIAAQPLSAPLTSGSTLLWYATRATGIVSLVLLTGTVMLGITGTVRATSARWPRLVTAGLHRNLALTALALVVIHVVTTVLDPFASISVAAAFIPDSSAYRPLWLSLGAVAFDLMLAVIVTSLLRDRLNLRAWRAVHLLTYASWPIALWHGLGTGTDTRLIWVLAINVACVAAVGWAIWWRLSLSGEPRARAAGLAALVAVSVLTAVFVLIGPLQSGWARRAGTPVRLLGNQSPSQPAPAGGTAPQLTGAPFRGTLSLAGPARLGPADDHHHVPHHVAALGRLRDRAARHPLRRRRGAAQRKRQDRAARDQIGLVRTCRQALRQAPDSDRLRAERAAAGRLHADDQRLRGDRNGQPAGRRRGVRMSGQNGTTRTSRAAAGTAHLASQLGPTSRLTAGWRDAGGPASLDAHIDIYGPIPRHRTGRHGVLIDAVTARRADRPRRGRLPDGNQDEDGGVAPRPGRRRERDGERAGQREGQGAAGTRTAPRAGWRRARGLGGGSRSGPPVPARGQDVAPVDRRRRARRARARRRGPRRDRGARFAAALRGQRGIVAGALAQRR